MSENRQANARKAFHRNFNYNWIGTSRCSICTEHTSVVNVIDTGTRVCSRCDSDLYKATGQLEKERWIRTGKR